MSVPIVDRVGNYIGLNRERKLFINVWFRYVIFIVYPLSSVLILTASLAGTSVWEPAIRRAPIALIMIIIGYLVGFPIKSTRNYDERIIFSREADIESIFSNNCSYNNSCFDFWITRL